GASRRAPRPDRAPEGDVRDRGAGGVHPRSLQAGGRLMAAKIIALTPEQFARLPVFHDEWLRIGSCTEPAERPLDQRAITAMYGRIDEPAPHFMWVDSPATGCLMIAMLGELTKPGSSLRSSLRSSIWSSLESSLGSSLWSSLESSLGSSLGSSLESSLESSLRSSLRSSLWSSLESSLRSSLGSSLESSLGSSLWSSLESSLESSLRSSIWSSLESSLRSSLGSSLESSLRSSLGSSLW